MKKGSEHEDTDEPEEYEEDDELDELFDLNVTMDMLNAPFKRQDEFGFFHKVFATLYAKAPQYMSNLLQSLTPEEKRYLQEHMQSKRVEQGLTLEDVEHWGEPQEETKEQE